MGPEDRKVDISRSSELLKPREKGRCFGVSISAVSGPSCRDQQWTGIMIRQAVKGSDSAVVSVAGATGQGEGVDRSISTSNAASGTVPVRA